MSTYDCYLDASGCTVCPECPGVAAVPTQIITSANAGWNAGANSITALDGDVHMGDVLSAAPSDAYVGFKQTRDGQVAPYRLQYAFRFYALGNTPIMEVWEGSTRCTQPSVFPLGGSFEIRRVDGTVSYYVNGAPVYESAQPSFGALVVNACLYSAGDSLA